MMNYGVRRLSRSTLFWLCRGVSSLASNFQFVEFRDLTDWPSIQSRLESLGPSLSSAHIGAAFVQTQKLLPRPPEEFLDGLSRTTVDHLELLDVKTASMVFHSCANMSYFDPELIQGLIQVVMEQLEFMDFRSLAKMMFNLGTLYQSWNRTSNFIKMHQFENLVNALASRITYNFCSRMFDYKMGSVLILGLAKLNYKEPNLMRHLTQLLMRTSSRVRMDSADVASIVFALSQLQFRDVTLIRHFGIEATRSDLLTHFSNSEIATVIYALCRLGIRGKLLMQNLIKEASKSWRMEGYTNQALCNILFTISTLDLGSNEFHRFLIASLSDKRISTHSYLDLVTIVHALGKRPVHDQKLLSTLLQQVTLEYHFSKLTARDLSILIFGFMQCGFHHDPALQSIIKALKQESIVQRLTPDQLARVVYALGVLSEDLGDAIHAKLQTPFHLRSFSLSGITRLVQGLASSRPQIPSLNFICIQEALQSHRLKLYSAKELKCVLESLVKMNLKNRVFVKLIEERIVDRNWFQKLPINEVCDLVVPLALLNQNPNSSGLEALFEYLLQLNKLSIMEIKDLIKLTTSCVEVGFPLSQRETLIDELSKEERFESMKRQELFQLVHCLARVEYNGCLWDKSIHKLDKELIQSMNLNIDSKIQLLKSFGLNFKNSRRVLMKTRILESLLKDLRNHPSFTLTQIRTLSFSLSSLSYKDQALLDILGDRLIQEEDFQSMDFILSLGELLGACFQLDHACDALLTKTEKHLQLLHEASMMDSSFLLESYLTHGLIVHFLNLKTKEGQLEPKLFEVCLDLMQALESRSIPLTHDQLRRLYLSFLCISYRPESSLQSRILRRAMETHIQFQKQHQVVSEQGPELVELVKREFGVSLSCGLVVEDADQWVDVVVSRPDRVVILFQQPGLDLDFHGDHETGLMNIKRKILEKHGYKVLLMKESVYDEMCIEEKMEWLQQEGCCPL